MVKRKIRFLSLIVCLVGSLSACLATTSERGDESSLSEATSPSQPESTSLPHFSEESISPGKMEAYSFLSSAGQEIDYLLYIPDEYHEDRAWPVVMSLHGDKGRRHNVEDARVMNPLNSLDPDAVFPFILVSPVSPTGSWSIYHQSMNELLDALSESLSINPNALILTGLSAGAYGGWHYVLSNPDQFVAFAPVAGGPGGDPVPENICLLKDLPIWIFHSETDQTLMPIKSSYAALDALEDCGSSSIRMTTYTDLSHVDSIDAAYADPDLYEWMLQQIE